jgi:predicted Zn-dependent protease
MKPYPLQAFQAACCTRRIGIAGALLGGVRHISGGNLMNKGRYRIIVHILNCLILIALVSPAATPAQDKAKKDDKEAKANAKDEKKLEAKVKKYEETLAKAQDKYSKDTDFREDVDYEYRKVQRDHAQLAFRINTSDNDDWVTTYSGEKLPKGNDTLYDNMLAQDYLNRLGQSLVPGNSERRYGFKITVSPIPDAKSLSTGTIYVTTGLMSLVDNEAQLAYVLSHEIAHIESDHWKEDVLVSEWIEDATQSAEKKGAIIGTAAGIATAGLLGSKTGLFDPRIITGSAGLGKFLAKRISNKSFEWSGAQEDEADTLALQYMLERNYDVREAQAFFDTMKAAAQEDPRLELDRFGDRKRAAERQKQIDTVVKNADSTRLAKTLMGATNLRGKSLSMDRNLTVVMNRMQKNQTKMADEIKSRLDSGEIIAGDGEFEDVMSALKRDNGIIAFYYDMYKLSARNLDQALAIRSDDSLGYFYYGKVMKQTARKPGEREKALQMFAKAIELDKRGANPESRLYFALTKMTGRTTNNIQETVVDLKDYVAMYQRAYGGSLPPNMNVIYDFMLQAGESSWTVAPYSNVVEVGPASPVKTGTVNSPAMAPATVAAPVPGRKKQ